MSADSVASSADLQTHLRQLIGVGRLPVGARLPSERQLAEQLRVARGTVRAALMRLQAEGLIRCSQGKTRWVAGLGTGAVPTAPVRSTRSGVIVILASMPNPQEFENFSPAWDAFIQLSASHLLQAAGFASMTLHPASLEERVSDLLMDPPAGVLAMHDVGESAQSRACLRRLADAGIPVVAYGSDAELAQFDVVTSDHCAGAADMTRWLIAQGRRRILRLWRFPQQHTWVNERDRGYELAMTEANLPVLPAVRTPELAHEADDRDAYEHVLRVLVGYVFEHVKRAGSVDAIMTATDKHACEVIAALQHLGVQPHRDVTVVGYDAAWPHVPHRAFNPLGPAATVDKSNAAIGRAMVELLQARIAGDLPDAPQRRLVPPRLVVIDQPETTST